MIKKGIVALCLIFILFRSHPSDFENNVLGTFLDIEKFFLDLSGEYGTNFFPFLNNSYGGRDQAFSQAFTAVADDISGIEANPAITSILNQTAFFFSHTKLFGDINYNALAYSMRFNELGFGVSFRMAYMPFTRYDMLGYEAGNGLISYSVINLNASYNFFRSYEQFGLALGTNVKFYIYGVPDSIYPNQSMVNVAFDLGLITRFNILKIHNDIEKNFSIGIVAKNFGPFTDGEPPPSSLNVGVSYRPIRNIMITTDLQYFLDYKTMDIRNFAYIPAAEFVLTNFFSIVTGFKIRSSPSASLGINLNFEQFDLSFTYNPDLVDLVQFSISGSIKLGDMGRGKKQHRVDLLYGQVVGYISRSEYAEAEEVLQKILTISPNYNPAKRTLKVVQQHNLMFEQLQEVIKESETIFD